MNWTYRHTNSIYEGTLEIKSTVPLNPRITLAVPRAYTKINLKGGGEICGKRKIPPPLGAFPGEKFYCKFKTFDFLDTLKGHIQSNYHANNTLSLLQTKLGEKNSKLTFYALHSSVSDLSLGKFFTLSFQQNLKQGAIKFYLVLNFWTVPRG